MRSQILQSILNIFKCLQFGLSYTHDYGRCSVNRTEYFKIIFHLLVLYINLFYIKFSRCCTEFIFKLKITITSLLNIFR